MYNVVRKDRESPPANVNLDLRFREAHALPASRQNAPMPVHLQSNEKASHPYLHAFRAHVRNSVFSLDQLPPCSRAKSALSETPT